MNAPCTTLKIRTLGSFQMQVNGTGVIEVWPDEALKVLFCSLLSPLDLSFGWDRLCRSMWGLPATRSSRRKLEEGLVGPLNCFLIRELGFTPLLCGREGIRLDRQRLDLDAIEFHAAVIDGLKQFSLGNRQAALEKFSRARLLYAGCYLPGIPGKMVASTRNELESLFRSVAEHIVPAGQKSSNPAYPVRPVTVMTVTAAGRPVHAHHRYGCKPRE